VACHRENFLHLPFAGVNTSCEVGRLGLRELIERGNNGIYLIKYFRIYIDFVVLLV
jgi:hypothetical protein